MIGPARHITPPGFLADPSLRALLNALPGVRIVGGAVRDTLAGRPVSDIDIATPWPPEQVSTALAKVGIRTVPTGLAHGTVTALLGDRAVEITTLRHDVTTDGRHAEVAFTDDFSADAARRDFSMNALSMTPDGAVFDYFGGIDDLRAGKIRFVGDPATRIAEDYLRILRFFRFFARYGIGAPDPDALAAIAAGVPGLAILSPERVWSELKRILTAPNPSGAVRLMAETGVLSAILPGSSPTMLTQLVAAGAPAEPVLRLAALFTGDVDRLSDRLRFASAEREAMLALLTAPAIPLSADDDTLRRAMADNEREALIGRSWLTDGARGQEIRARLGTEKKPKFPLEGRDALALGMTPGPEVGKKLGEVRDWWLAGGCRADGQTCRAELARRLGR